MWRLYTHSLLSCWAAGRQSARGLLTAASDPKFKNFAKQHHWHEHSEPALLHKAHRTKKSSLAHWLMGLVCSMTEENQAALTAMLSACMIGRPRSSSPLPEAALPTDESSTLPPEGASTQELPEPCAEEPPLVNPFNPNRAENFLYQPFSKSEKPWADQLAPELPPDAPPADTATAPGDRPNRGTQAETFAFGPAVANRTRIAVQRPASNAGSRPQRAAQAKALPSKPQRPPPVPQPKAALSPPCDWPPNPSLGFHEPKPDLQHMGLSPDTPLYAWDGSWWMNYYDLPFSSPPTCATRISEDHHSFSIDSCWKRNERQSYRKPSQPWPKPTQPQENTRAIAQLEQCAFALHYEGCAGGRGRQSVVPR